MHTKFLPDVLDRSTEDLNRRQHFHDPDRFRDYYAEIVRRPVLWNEKSERYRDWRQLVELGLMPDISG